MAGIRRDVPLILMIAAMAAAPVLAAGAETPRHRTRAEVEALIETAGTTLPDWWDSVPLNYPKTLDLTWPRAEGGWNTRKHVDHYLFSVITENPRRWRDGFLAFRWRWLYHANAPRYRQIWVEKGMGEAMQRRGASGVSKGDVRPPVDAANTRLPLGELSPMRFDELCLWMAEAVRCLRRTGGERGSE